MSAFDNAHLDLLIRAAEESVSSFKVFEEMSFDNEKKKVAGIIKQNGACADPANAMDAVRNISFSSTKSEVLAILQG
ncbi:hypothetical protein KIPB_000210 [Kipferlia bialata]|uniref:DUF4476 domain-containing protein n=1 Tax=Kipferlia bialata TaxID=797122 RepID=A0A9K3CN81_9EUKA|nr:hypothetical protein KIPB_000210 [Kipferlia bialata]|eukprot:g210.t1